MAVSYQEYMTEMKAVARAAGTLTLEYFNGPELENVTFKGQADLLCEADGAVEDLIRSRLTKSFPNVAFDGEEGGLQGNPDAEFRWWVDPIDGTTNFLSGLHYTISMALRHNDRTVAGIVFDPLADELFSAVLGQGAHMNHNAIRVSDQTDPARFVVGTGLPLDAHPFSVGAFDRLHDLREEVAAIRILGSCANSLAHVACGRLDGYLEGPTGYVDFAAGLLLVQEAGGVVTDFWGGQDWLSNLTTTVGSSHCQPVLLRHSKTARRH